MAETWLYVLRNEYKSLIRSFEHKETQKVFERKFSNKLPHDIQRRAYLKLVQLHHARSLKDLRNLPGNRLEQLKGNRAGQWSLRINKQWRICFYWVRGDVEEVEITDYH